jgi:putative hydrolase of the HAD superfamily
MVGYVFFDLDNTLYPKSCGLDREVNRRMTEFTAGFLGVTREEARRLRESEAVPYGTTLKWLCGCRGLRDVEGFLAAVHPENVGDYVRQNPGLGAMLRAMRQPRAVLTNAPMEHAVRVLRCLGIGEELPRIFDLRYNGFLGKPAGGTYRKLVRETGADIREVLFVDDMPRYLLPFRDLGGQVLLVDEEGVHGDCGLPSIREITELGRFLENL